MTLDVQPAQDDHVLSRPASPATSRPRHTQRATSFPSGTPASPGTESRWREYPAVADYRRPVPLGATESQSLVRLLATTPCGFRSPVRPTSAVRAARRLLLALTALAAPRWAGHPSGELGCSRDVRRAAALVRGSGAGTGARGEHARMRRAAASWMAAAQRPGGRGPPRARGACGGRSERRGPLGLAVLDPRDGDPRGDAADREGDVVLVSPEPEPGHGGNGDATQHGAGVAVGPGDGRHQARRPAAVARSGRQSAQAGQHLVRRPDLHRRRAAGGVRRQPGLLGGTPSRTTRA